MEILPVESFSVVVVMGDMLPIVEAFSGNYYRTIRNGYRGRVSSIVNLQEMREGSLVEGDENSDYRKFTRRDLNVNQDNIPKLSTAAYLERADQLFRIGKEHQTEATSRRLFFASTLFAAGVAIAPTEDPNIAINAYANAASLDSGRGLQYKTSPVNKRSGVTVLEAEQKGDFNVKFVTYLSRFLINFDEDCQKWWYSRAADIPRDATAEKVNSMRLKQFAAFAASVEVGLQEYEGSDGPCR